MTLPADNPADEGCDMTFSITRRRRGKTGEKRRFFPLFLPILALILACLSGFSGVLHRQLETVAANQAETLLSEAAATAISAAFGDREGLYDGIVRITRGDDGAITSIGTDPGAISALSAAFQSKLRETLSERGEVKIPTGNLTGSALFFGRGANLTFRTALSHALVTDIKSEFISVGINQTLHRVILETTAAVTVLLPGRNATREIKRSFPAAETVIVGRVPDVVLQPGQ